MKFEKNYFIKSKTSNYDNYLGKKYKDLCEDLIRHFKIKKRNTILDFGCGVGILVNEFVEKRFKKVKGTDISHWAIETGKDMFNLDCLEYYNRNLLTKSNDYVLCLDVLEHIPEYEINFILSILNLNKKGKVVMRVPVSLKEGEPYVLECSRKDKTHIQCHTKQWWINKFNEHGFSLIEELDLTTIYSSDGVFAGVFEK